MKKIIIYLAFSLFGFALMSCSDDPAGPNSGGGLGGGTGTGTGGGGTVTVSVQGQVQQDQTYVFSIKPSVDVKFNSVDVSVASENYNETLQFDPNETWSSANFEGAIQYPANTVQSGFQFVFVFSGTTVNGGQNFTVTTNYTVP